jgi:hypothetical protein
VQTTPQIFIDGHRIGGYDDLRRHFGLTVREPSQTSYRPVIAVFLVALLMAGASLLAAGQPLASPQLLSSFIAFAMCILAMLKLQDVESFSSMFLNYDLLARRFVLYAYLYPFAELLAGGLMLAGRLHAVAIPVALFVGSVGAVSVTKAVYIDRRELKCACVGGEQQRVVGLRVSDRKPDDGGDGNGAVDVGGGFEVMTPSLMILVAPFEVGFMAYTNLAGAA